MKKLQITLALSLHASNQEKRKAADADRQINMTSMRCWMPAGIIIEQTGRRITFEYSLVGGRE